MAESDAKFAFAFFLSIIGYICFSLFPFLFMLGLSSPRFSFLTLSAAFVVGMTVVGIGLAQLTIPTTLTNATIYIKDLFVSTDGSNSPANQKIILDGAAGTVTVKNLANTPVLGVDANG